MHRIQYLIAAVLIAVTTTGCSLFSRTTVQPSAPQSPAQQTNTTPLIGTVPPVDEPTPPPPAPRPEKEATLAPLTTLVAWKTEDPATTIRIRRCSDGIQHDPGKQVLQMLYGPDITDASLSVKVLQPLLHTILAAQGWTKCTPDDTAGADYYSNVGPFFAETFRKGNRLLQLDVNFSMGVGDTIMMQFEYSPTSNK